MLQRNFIVIVLALIPTIAVAMPQVPQTAAVQLATAAVNLELDLATRRPMVQVHINGQGPYWFVVDTGSPVVVIDSALARDLELEVVGQTEGVGAPGMPGSVTAEHLAVERLEAGGLRIDGATALGIDLRSLAGDLFSGILGMEPFDGFLVTFDYPAARLTIEPGELVPGSPGVMAIDTAGRQISLEIEVAGRTMRAHLDTGAPGGFNLPKDMQTELDLATEPQLAGTARLVGGESELWSTTLNGDIRIGDLTYTAPAITLSEFLRGYANIGYDVVSALRFTIDRRNQLLRLQRRQATAAAPDAPAPRAVRRGGPVAAPGAGPRLGIGFTMLPGNLPPGTDGLPVRLVEPGGAAAAAGVRVGDVLTGVNGRSVTEFDSSAALGAALRTRPLTLNLSRSGETIEIHIE